MVFALMTPVSAKAQETLISSDTIITEDNIYDVLEFLDLDSEDFIATDFEGPSVTTVGELEAAIEEAKTQPSEITCIANKISVGNESNSIYDTKGLGETTVKLSYTVDCGSYTVEFSADGTYFQDEWVDADNPDAETDTNNLIYVYKITKDDLELSFDPNYIFLEGNIYVTQYLGVGGQGIIKVGGQHINSFGYWDVADYA